MANDKNPITDRVKKMAAILEAAKKAGEEIRGEKAKEGQVETGQSSLSPEQRPS